VTRGVRLPSATTKINIRVWADDWSWLNRTRPGEANELMRSLLHAYRKHQEGKPPR